MSFKKEYIVGEDRIKILLIPNDNYSCLDFFINDKLSLSITYDDYEKLVNDIESHEKTFEIFLNEVTNETTESLLNKIKKLGYE